MYKQTLVFIRMFATGQKVHFERTNGKWSIGTVKEFKGDFVTVQWLSEDGRQISTKKVQQLLVKPLNSVFTKKIVY